MVRKAIVVVACALTLAGCGDRAGPSRYGLADARGGLMNRIVPPADIEVAADSTAPAPVPGATQQFSYTHAWSVRMSHESVQPRFARARDACLKDRSLDCKLVSAELSVGDGESSYTSATLVVQLPHGRLDGFEHALLAPLAGERPGDAAIDARSTQAQSVETAAGDASRKVAQLTAYRDRLAEIARRPNLSVDDIIKLEAERARVQGDLDDATGHQRDLTDGIAREAVTITLSERSVPVGPFGQLARNAASTLAESTAGAILFLIGLLPWLPILAAGIYAVSWLWRLFRRRQKAPV
ncbi:MAG TPA: DUF4349 domain-containing protein [Rhizomicrobium sp.]|jgi:hypothetical protein|nr:DUF4349 domain-containing protein [Rhizomicrobium sp.]